FDRPRAGVEPPVVERQGVGQIMKQGMPTCLRFEGESKGRIRIDVDRIDRIHLDRDGESHADLLTYWTRHNSLSALKGAEGENAGRGRRVNSISTAAAATSPRPDAVPCRPERAGRPARTPQRRNACCRALRAIIP